MNIKIYFLLFPFFIFANSISISSRLDKDNGYIGDVFQWSIIVEGGNEKEYLFPDLDNNEKMTVKSSHLLYEDISEKVNGIQFELVLWDTGNYKTPEYSVTFLNKSGDFDYNMSANSIDFRVLSVFSSEGQVTYKDIKGPVPVKDIFPLKSFLIIIILICLLIGIIFMWGRRIKPIYKKIDYSIIESPMQRAHRKLSELEPSLITKEYYSKLSYIIREYIERKYFIRTLEMTTEEIEYCNDFLKLNKKYFKDIIEVLKKADKVKYAKDIPEFDIKIKDKELIDNLISKL